MMEYPEVEVTRFRLDVSQETGIATLWMATGEISYGYKPILAWPNMEGVRDFALMLLDIDRRRGKEPSNPHNQTWLSREQTEFQ